MQQAGGEGIAGASGVDHLGWFEGWLNSGLILEAPTHRSSAIGDQDVGPLGQGRAYRSRIVGVEEPERFLAGHLAQACLLQQRTDEGDGIRGRS